MNFFPLVSIITINYNNIEDTIGFLNTIYQLNYSNFEVILVDNGSKNFNGEVIENEYAEIILVESKENLGFAGGNNLGLMRAQGEYIFFVNNDVVIDPNCLNILIESALKLKKLGAISPKFHFLDSDKLIEYAGCSRVNMFTGRTNTIGGMRYDNGNYKGLIETSCTHGGGMLVPRAVIDKVGPMSVDYFLYYEELDWSERIRKEGYKIYCQRDALVYHKGSSTVGSNNPLKTYFINRNRLLFMRKNYNLFQLIPFYMFFVFISFPKNTFKYIFKGEKKHLKAYIRSFLWHLNSKFIYVDD